MTTGMHAVRNVLRQRGRLAVNHRFKKLRPHKSAGVRISITRRTSH